MTPQTGASSFLYLAGQYWETKKCISEILLRGPVSMKSITIVFIWKEKHKFNKTKQSAQNAKINFKTNIISRE